MTDLDNGYPLEVVRQLPFQSPQPRREECDWFLVLGTFLPDQTSKHIGPGRKGRLDYGVEGQNVSQYKCIAKGPFERGCRDVSCGTHRTFVPLASASERMAEKYLSLSRVSNMLSEAGSMEPGCRIFPWRATVALVSMLCYRCGEVPSFSKLAT